MADYITDDTAETEQTNKLATIDAISSLSPQAIAVIRKKGESLIQAPELCREFWVDLRRTDLTLKGVINYITFESIYEKFRKKLLKI